MSLVIVPGAEAAGQRPSRVPGPTATPSADAEAGRVDVVGLGPGGRDWLTPQAQAVLAAADDIVGYGPYVDRVPRQPPAAAAWQRQPGRGQRAEFALDLARRGRRVAVVSSGDPGVFAMATRGARGGRAEPRLRRVAGRGRARDHRGAGGRQPGRRAARPRLRDAVAVGPAQAVGGHRPAPDAAAAARPRDRDLQPRVARRAGSSSPTRATCCSRTARADTPVVVGRAVGTGEQQVTVTTLGELDPATVDMRCLVIVGSSQSRVVRDGAGARAGHHPAPLPGLTAPRPRSVSEDPWLTDPGPLQVTC